MARHRWLGAGVITAGLSINLLSGAAVALAEQDPATDSGGQAAAGEAPGHTRSADPTGGTPSGAESADPQSPGAESGAASESAADPDPGKSDPADTIDQESPAEEADTDATTDENIAPSLDEHPAVHDGHAVRETGDPTATPGTAAPGTVAQSAEPAKAEPKKPKPSKRRGNPAKSGPDDPGAGSNASKPEPEPRVSTTDADARVMKMADGGFRPALNAQLAVDATTQLIAAVAITNSGSDMGQMSPMHLDIQQRYATTPDHWLADGGFTKLQAIDELTARGTQPVLPPPRSRNPNTDCLAPKDTDSPAQAQWRAFMRSDFAKALYIQRGATVECANAQLRRRGLHRFNVCGMAKARAVLLWHALAHNLMRMRSLGIAVVA